MTSTSKRIVCEFLLKYRHLADCIWLFAKRSSHIRMLFASLQEYVYIERSHRFRMQCSRSRSDVNAALLFVITLVRRLVSVASLEEEKILDLTY